MPPLPVACGALTAQATDMSMKPPSWLLEMAWSSTSGGRAAARIAHHDIGVVLGAGGSPADVGLKLGHRAGSTKSSR